MSCMYTYKGPEKFRNNAIHLNGLKYQYYNTSSINKTNHYMFYGVMGDETCFPLLKCQRGATLVKCYNSLLK